MRSRITALTAITLAACVASACTSTSQKSMVSKPRSKEYFSERDYGVKASPRVSTKRSNLPRGGGRDQIGKPYKVKGKWYVPKEDFGYSKVGAASWYGDAFHGRLTANGEVYDMTHLTAAHPTMPLPSYARVTNTKNGSSVIVRINDRGPFAHDRVIDLSKRAAEMLDYAHAGVAKVKVEYVGRAPLDGNDDSYLLASYRPGAADPASDGLASGVMGGMAGPSPSAGGTVALDAPVMAAAFPGTLTTVPARPAEIRRPVLEPIEAVQSEPAFTGTVPIVLPEAGPIVPERPPVEATIADLNMPAVLAYAEARVTRAGAAVEALAAGQGVSAVSEAVKEHIAVGTYLSRADAERQADVLATYGTIVVIDEGDAFSVILESDGRHDVDSLLELAWASGATDAMPVRD